MNKLYFLGKPGDGYGWGVANANLIRELSKLCNVVLDTSSRAEFDAPVFMPVVDAALTPSRKVKAPRQIGYCFTEWPLDVNAAITAKRYDVLFAGSDWNTEKLKAVGIKQAETLVQGVDFDKFKPCPPSERKGFVVFSGGKYEFRKGQDYVIAAMRHFMKQHADVVLLAAWHNPWPQTMESMKNSWLVKWGDEFNGLPMDRVFRFPALPNDKVQSIYAQSHIGLFPNRCEAGTNMVMCEYMATSRPVIATYAHGHKDVLDDSQYLVKNGDLDAAGWFNPPVSDIIHQLETAYNNRAELQAKGEQARKLIERFTWADAAKKICAAAFPQ